MASLYSILPEITAPAPAFNRKWRSTICILSAAPLY